MAIYCDYFYYTSGIFSINCYCRKKEELGKKDTSVSAEEEERYCKGYTGYKDCPVYNESNSSRDCYLTTACCEFRGLPDDCDELTTLRAFRDNYMKNLENGEEDIKEYYTLAPQICSCIDEQSEEVREHIYNDYIYHKVIVPCVELIKSGRNEEAYKLYKSMVYYLADRFLGQ